MTFEEYWANNEIKWNGTSDSIMVTMFKEISQKAWNAALDSVAKEMEIIRVAHLRMKD